MKSLFSILIFIPLFSIGQTFQLSDTVFNIGDKLVPQPNILFDLAKWNIRTESYPLIDSIAKFLLINNTLSIEIGYHLDNPIASECCIRLDQKRAQSIVDYLIEKGVDKTKLFAKGYDNSQPITVDSLIASKYQFLPQGTLLSDEFMQTLSSGEEQAIAHYLNRRVEFKIISINLMK